MIGTVSEIEEQYRSRKQYNSRPIDEFCIIDGMTGAFRIIQISFKDISSLVNILSRYVNLFVKRFFFFFLLDIPVAS